MYHHFRSTVQDCKNKMCMHKTILFIKNTLLILKIRSFEFSFFRAFICDVDNVEGEIDAVNCRKSSIFLFEFFVRLNAVQISNPGYSTVFPVHHKRTTPNSAANIKNFFTRLNSCLISTSRLNYIR